MSLFAQELKTRAKEETIVSDLTYDLRSGEADFLDKLVATTFGNMALDAIVDMNESGTITDWNAQAVTLFGWSQDEAVGRQLDRRDLGDGGEEGAGHRRADPHTIECSGATRGDTADSR